MQEENPRAIYVLLNSNPDRIRAEKNEIVVEQKNLPNAMPDQRHGMAKRGDASLWALRVIHSPNPCHMASTRCLICALMTIGVPHSRLVSPGHLWVASMPILLPRPDTGLAKSR